MAWYSYKAVTAEGEVIEGELEANDRRAVVERLRSQGHVPIRAEERRRAGLLRRGRARRGAGISQGAVALLTRELSMLLQSGLPLDRALSILSTLSPQGPLRRLVDRLLDRVRGGASLAEALEAQGEVFPGFYSGMVRAGEAGGGLEVVLTRLAETLERAQALRESVKSALIYPILVVILAVGSLIVMMTLVIPQFRPLFEESGKALPLLTQVVIGVSDFVRDFWWALAVALVVLVVAVRRHNASPEGRLRWDRWLIGLPLLGDLLVKIEVARLARTLGTLLANQVNVLNAVSMTLGTLGNRAVGGALSEIRGRLTKGEGLAVPMAEAGVFPVLAVQLIQVGEESGQLDSMLLRVAEIYDDEVKRTIDRLLALLVPVIIIVLGLVIALMIGSILMAIMSSYDLSGL
ncbi:MAG: type II secretion system F family protein [Rhodospirillales bacterium]|nr:type II secretion system F family protein [Rhodospirillales bacterium]MDH3792097.1 type II secretion system F family protein [Rhodospirillales bacterium]MDH3911802.1 type II secretion system F family protein [Rhodospirillales bacterium]MDH3918341.1 type II secretion system F family protein [Rhodospirillales bacterium]MDH3970220.1 type II secretion system F family protein [Rhodospirillales bacterium]